MGQTGLINGDRTSQTNSLNPNLEITFGKNSHNIQDKIIIDTYGS